jgi:hypothetical protein
MDANKPWREYTTGKINVRQTGVREIIPVNANLRKVDY